MISQNFPTTRAEGRKFKDTFFQKQLGALLYTVYAEFF